MSWMTDNVVFLAFIAALCSADMMTFGQFMICRPIFCAPLMGFFMGDIGTSVWVGIIAEMIWINATPMGIAIPIDISLLGVLPAFWMCKYFAGLQEAAIWGLVLAVPFAYLYKIINAFGKDFNTRVMYWVEKGVQKGKYRRIDIGIIAGLFFFVAKAFLFYIFAMTVGGWMYKYIYLKFPTFVIEGFRKAWYLLPISGFGIVVCNFKKIKISFLRH